VGLVAVQLDDELVVRPVGVDLEAFNEGVDLRSREAGRVDHSLEEPFELFAGAGLDNGINEIEPSGRRPLRHDFGEVEERDAQ
jgi:hypothetical protein